MDTRTEKDSVGSLEVPADAYYGIHAFRAGSNFDITRHKQNEEFIKSLVEIKKAAAIANHMAGSLPDTVFRAITEACDYILSGHLSKEFITDPIQGGAGTSANMNANEVIANKALEILGHKKGEYQFLHPNDHVNMCQSTNDVYPTAGKLTAIKLLLKTIKQLELLHASIREKAAEFKDVVKMGRTQLQDAVPVSLGQSFHAYGSVIVRDIERLKRAVEELRAVNIGGTAIGTSINATQTYFDHIAACISEVSGIDVIQSDDLIDATQNLDSYVFASGSLKTCAVDLSKIANDLRLMSSGPKTGFNEISLPPMQNGSSIMPGKVNPVIPEVVSQVAFNIIGNDVTISMAAEAGQLELNAFEPVLFYNLFESIETLGRAAETLTVHCVEGIRANSLVCTSYLNKSVGTVTALCPYIGYVKSAEIAKKLLATGKSVREYVTEENILTEDKISKVLSPSALTHPLRA